MEQEAGKLIDRALRSLDKSFKGLLAGERRIQKEMRAALLTIQERLSPAIQLLGDEKGFQIPDDPAEFIQFLADRKETQSFVTPEVLELLSAFNTRVNAIAALEETGGAERGKTKAKRLGRLRRPAQEGDEERLKEKDGIILDRARKDGEVRNDESLRQALGITTGGVGQRLRKLAKGGFLKKEGDRGASVRYVLP